MAPILVFGLFLFASPPSLPTSLALALVLAGRRLASCEGFIGHWVKRRNPPLFVVVCRAATAPLRHRRGSNFVFCFL